MREEDERFSKLAPTTYNIDGRFQCPQHLMGKVLKQILDKFNLLCVKEKEETYYKVYSCQTRNIIQATENTIPKPYKK